MEGLNLSLKAFSSNNTPNIDNFTNIVSLEAQYIWIQIFLNGYSSRFEDHLISLIDSRKYMFDYDLFKLTITNEQIKLGIIGQININCNA